MLLDVVHSHISSNADDGLAGFDLGQPEEANYFKQVGGWVGAWVRGASAAWATARRLVAGVRAVLLRLCVCGAEDGV